MILGATADPLTKAFKQAEKETQKLQNDIEKMSAKLKDQSATFGMSGRQADIYRLSQRGASKEQINSLKALDANLSGLEKADKLKSGALSMTGKTGGMVSGMVEEGAALLGVSTVVATAIAGVTAAGVAMSAAIAIGLKSCVDQFKPVEASAGRLTAALAMAGTGALDSTSKVSQMAKQISATLGTNEQVSIEAGAVLGRMGMVKGDALAQAVSVATDLGAALGKDGPAAEQLAHALRNPAEGYLELAQLGVMFSDSQVNQIQALQRSGDKLGAQKALMDALEASQKRLAENTKGPLNKSMEAFDSNIKRISTGIGQALAPAVTSFMEKVNSLISPCADAAKTVGEFFNSSTKAAVAAESKIGSASAKAAGDMKQLTDEQISAQAEVTQTIKDLERQAKFTGLSDIGAKGAMLGARGANDQQVSRSKDLERQVTFGKQLRDAQIGLTASSMNQADAMREQLVAGTGLLRSDADRLVAIKQQADFNKQLRDASIKLATAGMNDLQARKQQLIATQGMAAADASRLASQEQQATIARQLRDAETGLSAASMNELDARRETLVALQGMSKEDADRLVSLQQQTGYAKQLRDLTLQAKYAGMSEIEAKKAMSIDQGMSEAQAEILNGLQRQADIRKTLRGLAEQTADFDKDAYLAKADQMARQGYSQTDVEKVKRAGAELQGKELAKSLENPLDKFKREMGKLEQLRAAGGVDDKTYQRQKTHLTKDLIAGVPKLQGTAGGPLAAGSQEAYGAMMNFRAAGLNTAEMAPEKIAQAELAEQKQTNRWLQLMVKGQPAIAQFAGL